MLHLVEFKLVFIIMYNKSKLELKIVKIRDVFFYLF